MTKRRKMLAPLLATVSAACLASCALPPLSGENAPCGGFGYSRRCVHVPLATPQEDAAGKAFAMPPPDMARIYITRPYPAKPDLASTVFLNGRRIALLAPATYTMFDIRPGTCTIRIATGEQLEAVLAVKAGKIYYLQYRLDLLFDTWTASMTPVPASEARSDILHAWRVGPLP